MINLEKYSQPSKKKYKIVKIELNESQSQKNLEDNQKLDKSPMMQKKRIKKKSKSKSKIPKDKPSSGLSIRN